METLKGLNLIKLGDYLSTLGDYDDTFTPDPLLTEYFVAGREAWRLKILQTILESLKLAKKVKDGKIVIGEAGSIMRGKPAGVEEMLILCLMEDFGLVEEASIQRNKSARQITDMGEDYIIKIGSVFDNLRRIRREKNDA